MTDMSRINAQLGAIGKRLLSLLAQNRPMAFRELRVSGRLLNELLEAETHFKERKLFHSEEFERRHPRPAQADGVMRHMVNREAFVEGEANREMHNWVNNYPVVDTQKAQKLA